MNFFVLVTYELIIFFVFTINVILADLIKLVDIYKLPKLNENYESYSNSVVRGSDGNDYEYENWFDHEEFFEITHNLDSRNIPKRRSDTYNYDVYSSEYENYCLQEHTSYESTISPIGADCTPSEELKKECLAKILDKGLFDLIQMQYLFLPQPVDTDVKSYIDRINKLDLVTEIQNASASTDFEENMKNGLANCQILFTTYIKEPLTQKQTSDASTSTAYEESMKEALSDCQHFFSMDIKKPLDYNLISDDDQQKHFIKLSSRRVVELESYMLYASRILMKGYYPLTYELWYYFENYCREQMQKDFDLEAAYIN